MGAEIADRSEETIMKRILKALLQIIESGIGC
jgi:hypothetical protein